MANSKLVITFNKDALSGNFISFYLDTYGTPFISGVDDPISRTWETVSSNDYPNRIVITTPTSIAGESTALSFATSLSSLNTLTVTRVSNVVTIESISNQKYFVSGIFSSGSLIDYYKVTGSNYFVTWQAINVDPNDLILSSVVLSAADSLKCNKVKATISTNKLSNVVLNVFRGVSIEKTITDSVAKLTNKSVKFKKIKNADDNGDTLNLITFLEDVYYYFMVPGNTFVIENSSLPYNNKKYSIFSYDRVPLEGANYGYTLTVKEDIEEVVDYSLVKIDYSNSINVNIEAPQVLNFDDFSVNLIQLLNNKINAVILKDEFCKLNVQYSIDNVNWQTSNVFQDLTLGYKTLYIKDDFGCSVSLAFYVENINNGASVKKAFSYISNSMSIRFKKLEAFDCYDVFKNDENTLSFEEQVNIPYLYTQKFMPSNLVKTQLLTNYENIDVNVLKCDGSKDSVQLVDKINFLNVKDKRDGKIFKIEDNKTGIKYIDGYVYNYDTNVVVDSYILNGKLPEYAIIGNSIFINTIGWFKIIDLIYDESIDCNVIVIAYNYTEAEANCIVSSNWNKANYDVKEFSIDFSTYNNQDIQIEINQTMSGFEDFNYLSEPIQVVECIDKNLEIKWHGSFDTDVYYSTGIKNVGNFEFANIKSLNESDVSINKNQNSSVMISSSSYDKKELTIEDLSTVMAKKLINAFLHKELYVNNIKYITSSSPSVEQLDNTNLHKVSVSIIATDKTHYSIGPSQTLQPGSQPNNLSTPITVQVSQYFPT